MVAVMYLVSGLGSGLELGFGFGFGLRPGLWLGLGLGLGLTIRLGKGGETCFHTCMHARHGRQACGLMGHDSSIIHTHVRHGRQACGLSRVGGTWSRVSES